MFKRIILILALICMIVLPVFGQTGTYTSHNLFYLPEYGAYGLTEYNTYNEYMEIADNQIWANKTSGGGATTFLGLTDTPSAYDNGKYAKSTADGIVFDTPTGGGTVTISGTPIIYDYARFTDATTIEGRSYVEVRTDLGIDLSLYYLKTAIDTLSEVETIYSKDVTDSDELAAALGAYYLKTAIDTQGEMETIWGVDLVVAGDLDLYYLKTAIDTQGEVEAIWTVTLATDAEVATALADYYLKVAINTQAAVEAIWGVSLVNDGDLDLYYLKTAIDTLGEVETIYSADITDSTELAAALGDYYLKTSIDTLGEVETIYSANIIDTTEMATALTDYYLKTAIDSQSEMETIWSVALCTDGELTTALTDYYLKTAIDTQGEIETIWGVALLNDITGEDFADLADIPAHPAAATKVLETTIDGYAWIDTPSGGGASELSDLSDVGVTTPTDKYLLVADGDSFESRAISSSDLSDVASIAMLDEEETVTNWWTFKDHIIVTRTTDTAMGTSYLDLIRDRDGDPTRNVSSGDYLGEITFGGYHTSSYSEAARIFGIVDGTPGEYDMPGRLEFCTTPDGDYLPLLRMAIDSVGNIKMGDGVWTNYVNISNLGVLTLEGTANIEGVDANELSYLDGITSDIQTQLDAKKGNSYYSALSSDHTYSDNSDTDSQPVGESVVFGDLLYPDWTAEEWLKADADLAAKMPGLRIALESKTDGQTCLMLVKGYIRDDSAFDFAGSMIYTSVTPGAMSSTAPTETGDQVQRVGVAKSADILFFDPSIDVGEI